MKKKSFYGKLSALICSVLVAATALSMTACSTNQTTQTPSETSSVVSTVVSSADTTSATSSASAANGDVTELGQGQTAFHVVVTGADGSEKNFAIKTDEKTVGAALLGLGLIAGEDSEYGLYVKTVDGVTADYDKDKTYWAFYVNGEYATKGVDQTDVEDGATYTFAIQK